MKRFLKKGTAMMLLACLVAGSIPAQGVLADQISDNEAEAFLQNDEAEETEVVDDVEAEEAAQEVPEAEEVETDAAQDLDVLSAVGAEDPETEELTEDPAEAALTAERDYAIDHMVIVSPYLETPGTEQILLSLDGDYETIEEMVLHVQDDGGNISDWELSVNVDNLFLFEKTYEDDSEAGAYEILSIGLTDDVGKSTLVLADYDMEARFGVDEIYDGYENLQPLGEEETSDEDLEVEATVVTLSADTSKAEAADQIAEALEQAEAGINTNNETEFLENLPAKVSSVYAVTTYATKSTVVAIDPGHDSTHSGTSASGYKEHELTLKIAQYCKEELEKYSGVTVYMTRTSNDCPYPETKSSSSATDIAKRVAAAADAGACVYVSIHLNSYEGDGASTSTSAKGAEVIVSNGNGGYSDLAAEGRALAQAILDELEAIGVQLRSNSIYSKDASSDTYSDGSKKDYYAVHNNCNKYDIPGIIVENAFQSHDSDVENYLSTEEGLKKLGVADATGIAKYLGLSDLTTPTLKEAKASNGSITVTWNSVSGADGYRVFRKTSGGSWGNIALTTSTSYTDSKVEAGTTYIYTVRAYSGTQSEAVANAYSAAYWSGYDSTGVSAKVTAALSTPSLKSATLSGGAVNVTWSSVSGASGYRVFRKKSGGSWSNIGLTTSTSYTDTDVSAGTTYIYTVRAYKGDQSTALNNAYYASYWSGYDSTGVSVSFSYILSTPTLGSATTSGGSIKVTWSAVSGASGYSVHRKTSGGSWSKIGMTTSTSYTDSDVSAGTTYIYTVRAYKGDQSTATKNAYSGTYWSNYNATGVSAKATAALSTPTLGSATTSGGSIKVTWSAVSGAGGYSVHRKTSGGSWSKIGMTTSTSYTDSNVDAGTTYIYTVRAYKGDQTTAVNNAYKSTYWSDYNTAGVSVKATAALSTPTLGSATASGGSIKVTWSAVSGAGGYSVHRKTSGGSWSKIGMTTSTSYTDSNVDAGTTYIYTVRAYKGDQTTAVNNAYKSTYWSGYNSTGVSAKAAALDTPKLKSASVSDGSVKITWNSVSGAGGYRVFRKTSGGSWGNIGLTTSTSYTDSDVDAGTTYIYTVRAYKGDQSTALKNTYSSNYWSGYDATGLSVKATSALSTPTLKSASASNGSITVTWNSVSGAGGYRVFRKTSGGSWGNIDLTTATSYTDSDVDAGTTYIYTVRAYKGDQSTALKNTYKAPYWSGYDATGVSAKASYALSTPSLVSTAVVSDGLQITWKSVSNAGGYTVYRKTATGSWSRIGSTTGTSYTDTNGLDGQLYYYTVRAYKGDLNTALAHAYEAAYWSGYDSAGIIGSTHEIMGTTTVTAKQLVAMFDGKTIASGASYTVEELAEYYIEEAKAEGVKADVAWCQMILETGWLKFTGDVKVGQNNFAGIGATGGGAAGNSFDTPRLGVRAQIQHLKAYASTDALNQTCVDPRFDLVTRGCAKYVEILGAKENPTGSGWAGGAGYGASIINLMNQIQ